MESKENITDRCDPFLRRLEIVLGDISWKKGSTISDHDSVQEVASRYYDSDFDGGNDRIARIASETDLEEWQVRLRVYYATVSE
ncbi:hypothetical protein K9M41_00770 [Candidatus Gracilibacteria bacterium]|nr:hypothetical protein [Candidatus Gracilibacteria bacterium]